MWGPQALALGLALLLGACAAPPPDLPTARQLDMLVPEPMFGPLGHAHDWAIAGAGSGERAPRLTAVQTGDRPAIRVGAGDRRLIAVRRAGTLLPATPFLSWSWQMSPSSADLHPIRLIVGLRSQEDRPARRRPPTGDPALPDHQRLLSFVFGASALQRGTLVRAEGAADSGVYIVSGGGENTGIWRDETADLEDLYRRLWPADDPAWVEVVFIGIVAEPATAREAADVRGIELLR